MERVRFSIVVVCLNAGERLVNTINSIRMQTCKNYEIIVKDGMSEDGSLERLPQEENIRIYREKDRGIYDAMNQAVSRVTGETVYFLNCGDVFYDETVLQCVEEQMERYLREKSGDLGNSIFYGDIFEHQSGERVSSNPQMDAFGCYRNVPCHQACFYGTELVQKKPFEEKYRVRADYDHFLWCFFEGKAKTLYMPVLIADYEGGGFSESGENRKRSREEHREITAKYMDKGQLFRYRLYLFATLSAFRTWLAHNRVTAHLYQKVKALVYRKRGKTADGQAGEEN